MHPYYVIDTFNDAVSAPNKALAIEEARAAMRGDPKVWRGPTPRGVRVYRVSNRDEHEFVFGSWRDAQGLVHESADAHVIEVMPGFEHATRSALEPARARVSERRREYEYAEPAPIYWKELSGRHWQGRSQFIDADIRKTGPNTYELRVSDNIDEERTRHDSFEAAKARAVHLNDHARRAKARGRQGRIYGPNEAREDIDY